MEDEKCHFIKRLFPCKSILSSLFLNSHLRCHLASAIINIEEPTVLSIADFLGGTDARGRCGRPAVRPGLFHGRDAVVIAQVLLVPKHLRLHRLWRGGQRWHPPAGETVVAEERWDRERERSLNGLRRATMTTSTACSSRHVNLKTAMWRVGAGRGMGENNNRIFWRVGWDRGWGWS